jgi:hypothetical protein
MPIITVLIPFSEKPQQDKTAQSRTENNAGFKHGVKPAIVGQYRRHHIGNGRLFIGLFQMVGGDMGAGRGCGIPPGRKILGGIEQKGASE